MKYICALTDLYIGTSAHPHIIRWNLKFRALIFRTKRDMRHYTEK